MKSKQQMRVDTLKKVALLNLKKDSRPTRHFFSIQGFNKTDFDWSQYLKTTKKRKK
jgi:hypothetical protein|tara:strand:+ start:464 stop:631 length:168 start_codon:yes stop_codon:yes gene_type:complete